MIEIGQKENPDGRPVPDVLDHGLNGLSGEAVDQLTRVFRLPCDVADVVGCGIGAPHALARGLSGVLGILQTLVATVFANLKGIQQILHKVSSLLFSRLDLEVLLKNP